jgi:hypothetical protein
MFNKRCCLKKMKGTHMNMPEWIDLLSKVGLIDELLTKREARLCFSWSKMRVADEVKRQMVWTHMTFLDFLEGLARLADLKNLPTDAQLAEGGYANVAKFMQDPKRPPIDDTAGDSIADGGLFSDRGRPLDERLEKLLLLVFAKIDPTVVETGRVDKGKLMQIMREA